MSAAYQPFMPPEHAATLAGQRYVVLRPSGTVAVAYEDLRGHLTPRVRQLGVTGPPVGHVTLAGIDANADVPRVDAAIDAWAGAASPVELRIQGVSRFPAPFQIVVVTMARTASLVDAFTSLNDNLRLHGVPSLIHRSVEDWNFHMSMFYCSPVSSDDWDLVVAAVHAQHPPADATEIVPTADVAVFDAVGREFDGGVRVLSGCISDAGLG